MRKVADTPAERSSIFRAWSDGTAFGRVGRRAPRCGNLGDRSGVVDLAEACRRWTSLMRAQAIEDIVAHVWTACIGESSTIALYAVGGFGRGAMFPFPMWTCSCCANPRRAARPCARWNRSSCCCGSGPEARPCVAHAGECRANSPRRMRQSIRPLDARRIAGAALLDAGIAARR
jgi:hypothetical protein